MPTPLPSSFASAAAGNTQDSNRRGDGSAGGEWYAILALSSLSLSLAARHLSIAAGHLGVLLFCEREIPVADLGWPLGPELALTEPPRPSVVHPLLPTLLILGRVATLHLF